VKQLVLSLLLLGLPELLVMLGLVMLIIMILEMVRSQTPLVIDRYLSPQSLIAQSKQSLFIPFSY